MGEFSLAAAILGLCILLAAVEVVIAIRKKTTGADATDWKRARGIVWIGIVLAALAWFVQRMMD